MSLENVARNGRTLFSVFHQFIAFEIIQNVMRLHINIREDLEIYKGEEWNVQW
jgi:hypothetical protein